MSVKTPNDMVFSEAAKIYLCADVILPEMGGLSEAYFGYASPYGRDVDMRTLYKGIIACTLQWLEENRYITVSYGELHELLRKRRTIVVNPIASGAPGVSGTFLEVTGWQPMNLIDICERLLPLDESPIISFLDWVSLEFQTAGILTRGGYAAHGNVWNMEWLEYLHASWPPEVAPLWQRAHARPDFVDMTLHRDVMVAVASQQRSTEQMDARRHPGLHAE